jgi:AsmA-like C-terminal region/AsmA family
MRRRSKLTLALAALGALLIVALIVAPRLLNLRWLRDRVIAEAGERLGAEVRIDDLHLALLPVPHVVLEGVALSLPGVVDLESSAASVYPRILPLLGGQVRLSRLRLAGLDVSVHSSAARPEEQADAAKPKAPLAALQAFVMSQAPGITLVADGAHLSMSPGPADEIRIEGADGVALQVDAGQEEGGGVAVRIDADVATAALRRGDQRLALAGGHVSAAVHVRGERLALDVSEIRLKEPGIEVSGRAVLDPQRNEVSIDAEGHDLSIPPTLAAAAFLAPGTDAVGDVAEFLRAGVVRAITVSASGSSLSDLASLDAFRIGGRLEEGTIQLPLEGLQLENASGDVAIEKGVLSAKNVAVGVGGSRLLDGTMHVDLTGDDPSLRIESENVHLVVDEMHQRAKAAGWLVQSSWGESRPTGSVNLSRMSISGPVGAPEKWRVLLEGSIDGLKIDSAPWSGTAELRGPLSLPRVSILRENGRDTASGRAVSGSVECEFEVASAPDRLDVSRLRLHDPRSDATLHLVAAEGELELGFSGALAKETFDALLVSNPLLAGSIEGDFQAHLLPAEALRSTATGHFEATDLTIPGHTRVHVAKLSLSADASRFVFDADGDAESIGKANFSGAIDVRDEGLVVDATLRAGDVSFDELLGGFDSEEKDAPQREPKGASPWRDFVHGKVDVQLDALRYRRFRWEPFHAEISLPPGGPVLTVREARICGITTDGAAALGPSGVHADVSLAAKNQPFDQSVSCLFGQEEALTGNYDVEARISADGAPAQILRSLRGPVQLEARQGLVRNVPLIAHTLAAVNVATGRFGSVSDLRRKGLPYDLVSLRGELKDGRLKVDEGVLEGPTVKMTGRGSVDLLSGDLDLTLIVAPLRTVDSAVGEIPIVGNILGGSLVSIPVRVKGDFGDPSVTPLDPSAVGEELIGVMERTLNIPRRALRTLLPGSRSK